MKKLFLFDVDGTLTESRQKVEEGMLVFLQRVREKHKIGFVGGSNLAKQVEQLGENVLDLFDYCFPENGLVAYKDGKLINSTSIKGFVSRKDLNEFISWVLRYIADLDIPLKTGTFVEFRTGMINICPVGRNCSYEERLEFFELDRKAGIRAKMVEEMEKRFEKLDFKFSIGGQISIDVFPKGWDKTFCLQFLVDEKFEEIHFFGDKTHIGGNDYEIFVDERTIGHIVESPADTKRIVSSLL